MVSKYSLIAAGTCQRRAVTGWVVGGVLHPLPTFKNRVGSMQNVIVIFSQILLYRCQYSFINQVVFVVFFLCSLSILLLLERILSSKQKHKLKHNTSWIKMLAQMGYTKHFSFSFYKSYSFTSCNSSYTFPSFSNQFFGTSRW